MAWITYDIVAIDGEKVTVGNFCRRLENLEDYSRTKEMETKKDVRRFETPTESIIKVIGERYVKFLQIIGSPELIRETESDLLTKMSGLVLR